MQILVQFFSRNQFIEPIGDRDMTVSIRVDTRHLLAEENAVCGGVAEVVDSNIIVNHLMKNSVLNEFLWQVIPGVDTEGKIGVVPTAKEPFAAFDKGDFAEESTGIGEFDGDRRKRADKEAVVIIVEMLLNIFYCRNHKRLEA